MNCEISLYLKEIYLLFCLKRLLYYNELKFCGFSLTLGNIYVYIFFFSARRGMGLGLLSKYLSF